MSTKPNYYKAYSIKSNKKDTSKISIKTKKMKVGRDEKFMIKLIGQF